MLSSTAESFAIKQNVEYCAPNYDSLPIVVNHGKGPWIWDEMGDRYLDFGASAATANLGYGHPRVLGALRDQAGKIALVYRAFHAENLGIFLEKLCKIAGFEQGMPLCTGAEAVEAGIKAARRWGYRHKNISPNKATIIVFENSFHGRTSGIVSGSTIKTVREDFGPFMPGFKVVPYGNIEAFQGAIDNDVCATIVESIQEKSGLYVPPKGWLKGIREICTKNNVLMLVDEVQTGLCRTGQWFAYQHEEIHPDGIMVGKALGGGVLPMSAFLTSKDIMSVLTPGSHGSTFGGYPLGSAVAMETLKVMQDENMCLHAQEQGEYLKGKLQALVGDVIKQVRGKGLFLGISIHPEKGTARDFCEKLLKKNVMTSPMSQQTVRITPPLTIRHDEIDWGLERLEACLQGM